MAMLRRSTFRCVVLSVFLLCCFLLALSLDSTLLDLSATHHEDYVVVDSPATPTSHSLDRHTHPIPSLLTQASEGFTTYLSSQSTDLPSAVAAYRKRYNRPPPPGFDAWFAFAQSKNSQIIDDYDQISRDLSPFWALPPSLIRERARQAIQSRHWIGAVQVKDGKLVEENRGGGGMRDLIWDVLQGGGVLPDMEIAVNELDEPRVVVEGGDMERMVEVVRANQRHVVSDDQLTTEWTRMEWADGEGEVKEGEGEETKVFVDIDGQNAKEVIRMGCPPSSLARRAQYESAKDPNYAAPHSTSFGSFVTNTTLAKDVCHQPDLEALHGFFLSPASLSFTHALTPIFSVSKLNVFNDILYPATWYGDGPSEGAGMEGDKAWEEKEGMVYWRGSTTGGELRRDNWRGSHRIRFVDLVNNGEKQIVLVAPEEREGEGEEEWRLEERDIKEMNEKVMNVSFVYLAQCGDVCDEIQPALGEKAASLTPVPFPENFMNKYLIDMDGNAFSGRWYPFLRSNSVPVKIGAMFVEALDSRIWAWKHYLPVDGRMGDLYSALSWFMGGFGRDEGHDEEAKRIAEEGREWAAKALRWVDFEVYTYRLLLEYARVVDDNRDNLGFNLQVLDTINIETRT
ncbi:hypothetical protein SAICODRAFT_29075 [Saitoella complicata NRRL Y-17804]|nr:uncharacterized protein SAICODRAFT_29075 [Saitoella complicata NRRL Y-17804]ODQ55518.1 hypothetical protein SAICODRAFT_29075 [Saitoella complicata NRRL Y-17804]